MLPRIAIDAMGGDFGPRTILDGALAAARHFDLALRLVGPEALIRRELADRSADTAAVDIRILDAPDVVAMGESPAQALRRKPQASIRVAAEAVARGEADALVSAGHTGATVLAAHAAFGMLPGVDRPALAVLIPTRGERPSVLLDAGANVECRPHHLVQFAALGASYSRVVLGVPRPKVGLLSIGEEESKGTDLIRDAHRMLKATTLNFIGNVEGRDVYAGQADVIVCDGFTGNVALKISEGLVETVEALLGEQLASTFSGRVGYLLSRRAFRRFSRRVDYSEYGGAPLLGVAGVCLVGHGRSSAKAIRNAVVSAARSVNERFLERVGQDIAAAAVPQS
jgi:phosphate acyltransferase